MRKLAPLAALLLLTTGLAGCLESSLPAGEEDGKPVVYTSFYPLQYFTERLVGEHATVRPLIPVGAEPHDFEPGVRDIAAVGKAKAFVHLGYDFEPWLDGLVQHAANPNLVLITAGEGIHFDETPEEHAAHSEHEGHDEHTEHETHEEHDSHAHEAEGNETHDEHDPHEEHAHDEHESVADTETHDEHAHDSAHNETHDTHHDEHAHDAETENVTATEDASSGSAAVPASGEHGHAHGGLDPHVWLDPVLAEQVAANIAEGLVEAFPEHEASIRANLANLTADLHGLHEAYETALDHCEKDTLLVSHNAYGYLAHRYGFDVASVSGLTPGGEPSARHVQELVDFAREHNITILFEDALLSDSTLHTIADEVGGEVRVLHTLEGLTKDQRAQGLTYLDLQQHNVEQLKEALACE